MTVLFIGICSMVAIVIIAAMLIVYPAWKRYRIQCAITTLSKCINHFNNVTFPDAKRRKSHYLHDNFYKLIFSIYVNGPPKIVSTRIGYDKKTEGDICAFRSEIESLDTETQKLICKSMLAVGQLLFFNNPFSYLLLLSNSIQAKNKFNREGRLKNTAYLTVTNKNDVISFQKPCYA